MKTGIQNCRTNVNLNLVIRRQSWWISIVLNDIKSRHGYKLSEILNLKQATTFDLKQPKSNEKSYQSIVLLFRFTRTAVSEGTNIFQMYYTPLGTFNTNIGPSLVND
jgi:hypothetical protein